MPVIDSMQSMSFSSVYLDANITCIYTVDLMTWISWMLAVVIVNVNAQVYVVSDQNIYYFLFLLADISPKVHLTSTTVKQSWSPTVPLNTMVQCQWSNLSSTGDMQEGCLLVIIEKECFHHDHNSEWKGAPFATILVIPWQTFSRAQLSYCNNLLLQEGEEHVLYL